jgi:hypothetical protein
MLQGCLGGGAWPGLWPWLKTLLISDVRLVRVFYRLLFQTYPLRISVWDTISWCFPQILQANTEKISLYLCFAASRVITLCLSVRLQQWCSIFFFSFLVCIPPNVHVIYLQRCTLKDVGIIQVILQGLVQLEGLGILKIYQSPHRVSNPRPSGLYHSASTTYGTACHIIISYTN